MSKHPPHLNWLKDTGERIQSASGELIEVWELAPENEGKVLRQWAKHFRAHYCSESEIDELREGYGYSRAEYLRQIKFPEKNNPPGPSIRSGDFSEILVADFLEYLHPGIWVPRVRYSNKDVRNESKKGADVLGFEIKKSGAHSPKDQLVVFEVKGQLTETATSNRLQDAVNDSSKDKVRLGLSLNAIRQRLLDKNETQGATVVKRFQNEVDRPYQKTYGAALVSATEAVEVSLLGKVTSKEHVDSGKVRMILIRGPELMKIAHKLYEIAADTADES